MENAGKDMRDDLEFLDRPLKWPNGICCVKNNDGQHGFFMIGEPLLLNLGYVFDGGTGETESFKTVHDVIDAGWYVD